MTDTYSLPETTHMGTTTLRVESLDVVVPFYRDVLGFHVERDDDRATLTATSEPDSEPLVVLYETPDRPARSPQQAGLFHVAIRVPTRRDLADAVQRMQSAGASLTGASDHLVSEALYLRDPEGNGIEVYRDRPRDEWRQTADGVAMDTLPLDLDDLAEAGRDSPHAHLTPGTDIGHVHLEVTDLAAAESFYVETLGMNVRARYGDEAAFLAAGDYHHHLGVNTWNGRTEPAGESRGLAWFEVVLPDDKTLATLRDRLEDEGVAIDEGAGEIHVVDPDGIRLHLRT